jgi:ribose-phosphate pyrophosphokinase
LIINSVCLSIQFAYQFDYQSKLVSMKLISGTANVAFAETVSKIMGTTLMKSEVKRFSNGEINVKLGESVRDEIVYIIQSTCNPTPNDYLMELLIITDACKRASAKKIIAVMPIFGYARQDKKDKSRAPISGKLVANMIEVAGVDHVITVDLHANQIQGFFDIPVDNLYAEETLVEYSGLPKDNITVVSPDAGGVKRAKTLANRLNAPLAIIHKERKQAGVVSDMTLVGSVKGSHCIIVDDMADSCGTLCRAATLLMEQGAESVIAMVTHGVLTGSAINNINASNISKLIITDTIPLSEEAVLCDKIHVQSVAPLIAEVIRRNYNGESVSSLFK